ncbi:MAG: hypothetical protein ACK4YP_03780 [Myxococcota bacterium]
MILADAIFIIDWTPDLETEMLDAFIIERIRQRQNRQRGESAQVPLRIEVPEREEPSPRREEKPREERGIAIIDFTV